MGSWIELHQTNEESAPCPAAHVVVMSQCESCGTCLFKDVVCKTKTGVSKSLGQHTFMYKYAEDESQEGAAVRSQVRPSPLLSCLLAGVTLVSLFAAGVS